MPNPQQPELRRSEQTPALTPDAIESELEADPNRPTPPTDDALNRPGQPDDGAEGRDQDKPDLDDVADQLGTKPPA